MHHSKYQINHPKLFTWRPDGTKIVMQNFDIISQVITVQFWDMRNCACHLLVILFELDTICPFHSRSKVLMSLDEVRTKDIDCREVKVEEEKNYSPPHKKVANIHPRHLLT